MKIITGNELLEIARCLKQLVDLKPEIKRQQAINRQKTIESQKESQWIYGWQKTLKPKAPAINRPVTVGDWTYGWNRGGK